MVLLHNTKTYTYSEVHKATVMVLNMLGMKLSPKHRLDCFRLIVKLDRNYANRPEVEQARNLLTTLVNMRNQGLEPPHKNGAYLPRSLDDLK